MADEDVQVDDRPNRWGRARADSSREARALPRSSESQLSRRLSLRAAWGPGYVAAGEDACVKKATVTFSAGNVGGIEGESPTLASTRIVGHGSVTFCRTASGKLTVKGTRLIGHLG